MDKQIKELIEQELKRANEKFPPFHSAHEGYAVLKEEVEETQDELEWVQRRLGWLWNRIKDNNIGVSENDFMGDIYKDAVNLVTEAIQVAAMAKKFEQYLERQEEIMPIPEEEDETRC